MKKFSKILLLVLLLASCSNNKPTEEKTLTFELKGKLTNAGGEQLYLEEINAKGVAVIDTATLNNNGEFAFLHVTPTLGFYRVRITDANFAMLVLDSSQKVTLTGDARDLGNTFKVEGSPDSKIFWEINEFAKLSYQKRDSMVRSFEAYANLHKGDEKKLMELEGKVGEVYNAEAKNLNDYLLDVINKNQTSLVAVVALQQLTPDLSEDGFIKEYKKVDEALTKKYPNSEQVKVFHQSVETMSKVAIGGTAPDLTLATPEGKIISLSSFKGKYVLLDFWASWCAPCRAQNPNVVKTFKKYNPKGLEILSVSLDDKKDNWINAIKKDKLEWTQVSDLGGWQSIAAKAYNITSIPQTFLLDKEGKIIAKDLEQEALEKKLEEIFK